MEPDPHAKREARQRFERAAPRYHDAASLQREICTELLRWAGTETGLERARILDAGCGTGYGLELLHSRWPAADLLALDFARAMLEESAQRQPFPAFRICGDLEALPLDASSLDAVFTSLAVQWCALGTAAAEFHRVLRPGGQVLLATLGPHTLEELREAFSGLDPYRHTLGFLQPEVIASTLGAAGFRDLRVRREERILRHPDLATLLRSLKTVGASGVGGDRRRSLAGRALWQQVAQRLEPYRTSAGLPERYDVIYVHAHKEGG